LKIALRLKKEGGRSGSKKKADRNLSSEEGKLTQKKEKEERTRAGLVGKTSARKKKRNREWRKKR